MPVVRIVDPDLTMRMTEYVVLHVLLHHRRFKLYDASQRGRRWHDEGDPAASDVRVGVMGLGVLGSDAARKLKVMGFNVIGWSKSKKSIEGVETFDGPQLDAFLGKTDILVGLLPLTSETSGIFNASLISKLRRGGALGAELRKEACIEDA